MYKKETWYNINQHTLFRAVYKYFPGIYYVPGTDRAVTLNEKTNIPAFGKVASWWGKETKINK